MTFDSSARADRTLSDIELFSGAPKDVLARLNEQCSWFQVPADQVIIDGLRKTPHGVFILSEGEVEVRKYDANDFMLPLGRLSATSCFGEFAAINGEPGSATVLTMTPCLLAEIQPDAFLGLLNTSPAICLRLLKRAVALVKAFDQEIVRSRSAEILLMEIHRSAFLRFL